MASTSPPQWRYTGASRTSIQKAVIEPREGEDRQCPFHGPEIYDGGREKQGNRAQSGSTGRRDVTPQDVQRYREHFPDNRPMVIGSESTVHLR